MRVGIHSGPVTAAVVGKKDPRYHLFGSTVGYAEKMEETGMPGKVQISSTTYEYVYLHFFCCLYSLCLLVLLSFFSVLTRYVRDVDRYQFEARGGMHIEGSGGAGGTQFTFFVDGKPNPNRRSRSRQQLR